MVSKSAAAFPAGSNGAQMLARMHELESETRHAKIVGRADYKQLKHDFYDLQLALRLELVNVSVQCPQLPDALTGLGRPQHTPGNNNHRNRRSSDTFWGV